MHQRWLNMHRSSSILSIRKNKRLCIAHWPLEQLRQELSQALNARKNGQTREWKSTFIVQNTTIGIKQPLRQQLIMLQRQIQMRNTKKFYLYFLYEQYLNSSVRRRQMKTQLLRLIRQHQNQKKVQQRRCKLKFLVILKQLLKCLYQLRVLTCSFLNNLKRRVSIWIRLNCLHNIWRITYLKDQPKKQRSSWTSQAIIFKLLRLAQFIIQCELCHQHYITPIEQMADLSAIKRLLRSGTTFTRAKTASSNFRRSGTDLTETVALELAKKNSALKRTLNSLRYRTKTKAEYKRKLMERYAEILKNEANCEKFYSEDRAENLQGACEEITHEIMRIEIDRNVYKNIIEREQEHQLNSRRMITEIKEKLRRTDELVVSAKSIDEKFCKAEKEDSNNDSENFEGIKKEIVKMKLQHESLLRKIQESKDRIEKKEWSIKIQAKKREKLMKRIEMLVNKRKEYSVLKRKMLRYLYEYNKQYGSLKQTFQGNTKEEIMKKKEDYDIQKQTKRNHYMEATAKLNEMLMLHSKLKDNLVTLKAKSEAKKKTQKKEVIENQLIELQKSLKKAQHRYNEKILLVQKVINGIKITAARLQSFNQMRNLGPFRSLPDVALHRPKDLILKCSQMLLLLERRIHISSFLIWQLHKHKNQSSEWDSTQIITEYCPAEYANIVAEVSDKPKKKQRVKKLSGSLNKMLMSYGKAIAGKEIPLLVEGSKEGPDIKIPSLEKDAGLDTSNDNNTEEDNYKNEENVLNLGYDDNLDRLHSNAFDMLVRSSGRSPREMSGPFKVCELDKTKRALDEETKINEKFVESRTKQKLELKRLNEVQSDPESYSDYREKMKEKKRVTQLTVKIEEEMKKKPRKTVALATKTFDALEKLTKSMAEGYKFGKTKREIEMAHKSLPNFVNIILTMRKARREEKIEKIAKRCHYFPVDNLSGIGPIKTKQNLSSRRGSNETDQKEGLINLEKRIDNLKSFRQMETLPVSYVSAFDAFYYQDRPEILSQRKSRLKTSMPLSARNIRRRNIGWEESLSMSSRTKAGSSSNTRVHFQSSLGRKSVRSHQHNRAIRDAIEKCLSECSSPTGGSRISRRMGAIKAYANYYKSQQLLYFSNVYVLI
eukprot:TRINITY_DN2186_c0_g3_i1.p1 TRINITY_DN2186_c0_g3~~TRINITY_DN2186_c0_g3_i1.p1  ORF type:complete len:1109 (+),score=102.08 TRINITY_DN2186_c0_g3_i1:1386-4712(+)